MPYNSLSDFVQVLEHEGELRRITHPVKAELEIAEIADRVMKDGGPALLFENVVGKKIPVLINAFGSVKRMAIGPRGQRHRGDRKEDCQADTNPAAKDFQR